MNAFLKRVGLALFLSVLLPFVASAQIPGGNDIVINNTPVQGGTNGNCLYINGAVVGQQACGGSGSVTSVSVVTANGISGSVANPTSTPAITLSLGAITPTTVNGNTIATGSGTLAIAAGKTATFSNTITIAGNDGATLNVGAGGTVGPFTIGSTTISGGTSTNFLYDNAGIAGETSALTTNGSTTLTIPAATTLTGPDGSTWSAATGITSAGRINVSSSGVLLAANTGAYTLRNGATIISSPASASLQLGTSDGAAPVPQTLRFQSGATLNTAGVNDTIIGSLSSGSGTSGDLLLQTGVKSGVSGTQATATTAMIWKGETQEVRLPAIASDAGLTDTTVCQDTTNHGLHSGSGAVGICLGTSGAQFKRIVGPMTAGLDEIMKIKLWEYYYKNGYGDNGTRLQRGPTAQGIEEVLPDLVGYDKDGAAINYDWGAFIPIMMRAIQQQQAQIETLKRN